MVDELSNIEGLSVQTGVPLSRYTTWKVGGPAEYLVWADSWNAVVEVERLSEQADVDLMVLGRGSNILVADEGVKGILMRLKGELSNIEINGDEVNAGGGSLMSSVVTEAYRSSLSGLEFTFGIPGTVGGGVMMNAGAFDGVLSDVVRRVLTLGPGGEARRYEQFRGGYRVPMVPAGEVVCEAVFGLRTAEKNEIRKLMDRVRARRRETQPWGMSTAGSVFKNPSDSAAGDLIERCGLKGKSVGKAKISDIHANFIINDGGASASDIKALMELASREVYSRFQVKLEPEVQLVGFEGG